jgi:hypothetical protein
MDVKDYRRQYEAELANANLESVPATIEAAGVTGEATRLQEIAQAPMQRDRLADNVPRLLAILRNEAEPTAMRAAALRSLRAAAFLGEHFAPFRADFLDTLRRIARPETDAKLREDVLETLAAEKDAQGQELLRRGLREPSAALVPPAKALQFLGYDDHAGAAELAQDIFEKAADLPTKEAALRVLSTDAKAAGLFKRLLTDKSQPRSLRALSATGLHFLNPQEFAAVARDIVLDDSDYEDIRATSLGALASAPEHHELREDPTFLDRVRKISAAEGPLTNLRAAAARLMKKP